MPNVPPPSNGLGSNSNYFLNNNGNNLNGAATTIDVSTDIVASAGFGFQFNAYSPQDETCSYQQYAIVVDTGGQMTSVINNYSGKNASNLHSLFDNWVGLHKLPSATLRAGCQCRIALQNDPDGNVTAATYTVRLLSIEAAPGSGLAGYQTSNRSAAPYNEHVNYIGADNHVHELVYTDQWAQNDLAQITGAPDAAPDSALAGYQTSNNYEHVIFIGADNHVYELVYTNHWAVNDLTQKTGAPNATPGSALAGYQTSNNHEHVIFIGTDGHVHELVYTNNWGLTDLNNVVLANHTQSVPSAHLSPIVAFELDIVGYDNSQSTTLSSGSGTITYTAANAMTVANAEPSYCEYGNGTGETANTVYGELPTGSSSTFVQTFATSAATIKASKRNALIMKRPSAAS